MKKFITYFCILTLTLSLIGCDDKKQEVLTNHATYEGYELILSDAVIKKLEDGTDIVKVEAKYINSNEEPQYAYSSFVVKAYQNDKELEDISDVNGEQETLIQEVNNETEIVVSYIFKLEDESPVKVLIGEPTAEQIIIGSKTYFETE